MLSLKNVLLGLLAIFCVAFGAELYFYFQFQNKTGRQGVQNSAQNSISTTTVEIKGPVSLVGFLNLFDITKEQVNQWAKTSGPVEVSVYKGPFPTLTPEMETLSSQIVSLPRPATTKIVAGYFRSARYGSMIISQGGKDVAITFSPGIRLWMKDKDKVQIISPSLDQLIYYGKLSDFVRVNDLVLIPNITEPLSESKPSAIVVFK